MFGSIKSDDLSKALSSAAVIHALAAASEESMYESSNHPYGLFHDANPKVHMRNRKKTKTR